jgi:hypothetical protein
MKTWMADCDQTVQEESAYPQIATESLNRGKSS